MGIAESTWTTEQLEGITRNELVKRFLRETRLGITGVATGGSATTIDDTTQLKSTQYTTNDWVGGWARISKDAGGAGAAPEGEIRSITTYDPTTNGRITVDTFTTGVVVNDQYELWLNPNPKQVLDLLDVILKETIALPCYTVLTEVPDGDMEQGNTTDWTATNATHTKQTGAPGMYGKRYSRVVATAAGGYIESKAIRVEGSKGHHVSSLVRCGDKDTTATLLVRDATNGATIDSKTVNNTYMGRVWFNFNTPSTCKSVTLRLITVEDTKTTEWDEVCFQPHNAKSLRLPWWVKSPNQVKGIYKLNPHSVKQDLWSPELSGNREKGWLVQDGMIGVGQLRLFSNYQLPTSTPYYVYGIRNEEAYANDNSDIKRIDARLLIAHLAVEVFQLLKNPMFAKIESRWVTQELSNWSVKLQKLSYEHGRRLEDIRQGPGQDHYYYNPQMVFGDL